MNVLDIIRETSARETTRFSFELLPPLKGDGTRSVFTTIEALREFDPAFINVTFHRESIKETLTPDGHIEWHRMRRRPGTVGISAAIRDRFGIAILLIEHDMSLVMNVCQRIQVLDYGRTIAAGTPEEIANNPQVISAYLGSDDDDDDESEEEA